MVINCDLLIIGGSAGSLEVLLKVLPHLKTDLSFAIVLVLHRKPGMDSLLTNLLSSKTKIPVKELEEKEKIQNSKIYIVPPNYHLLIEKDKTFSLDASEKVNYSRPSIDVSFEAASEVYKENLVAILLSGSNSDGTKGLKKIKENGGITVIQNPESATVSYMPENARQHVEIDYNLKIEEIADFINDL